METLSFNTNFVNNSYSNKDILSVFKVTKEKNSDIYHGMSIKEISEIVSEKIITVVKKQFEIVKTQFESNVKK